jgi:transcriptional regulator with PAS, ATPase and Fis domain
VAPFDVNVMITGEGGTGKELLAKIIHLQSPRAARPFVPVNCGVLSGLIFEDKLFGHETGAFTGAIAQKRGCFESAHKGTLFLDEISELPVENQVDFLRVLEDFRFTRIGGDALIQVDVRLVSATNKDLRASIRAGAFREDLFYRIQVVPIHLPPLRERLEAIPKLVDHFINRLSARYRKPKPRVTPDVLDLFCRYDWPGNIREMKNLLERVFLVSNQDILGLAELPSDFHWHFKEPLRSMNLAEARRAAETETIVNALFRSRGDRTRAARILDISPRTLRHKIRGYNIRVDRKGNRM